MFIDIHSHIMPHIDDGADSFDESCELILQAYYSGTSIMVATPHYNNPYHHSNKYDKDYMIRLFRKFKSKLVERKIPVNIFLGSEFLVSGSPIDFNPNRVITINETRYLLVEFNFNELFGNILEYLDNIQSYGFIPIIAHPERYTCFNEDFTRISPLINEGNIIQINKGSIFGQNGQEAQKTSISFLKNEAVHIIASDCHNSALRNADMSDLYSWMLDHFSTDYIKLLTHDNPKKILLDNDI